MAKLPAIEIIRDTREKEGWFFDAEEKSSGKVQILGTIVDTMKSGDYCIKGYEDLIVIERKKGLAEIFVNYMPKEHKERFENEMVRLLPFKHKYLIIETNLNQDLMGFSVPQLYKGPPSSKVVDWIFSLQRQFGIIPIFAGDSGKRIAKNLFKEVIKENI